MTDDSEKVDVPGFVRGDQVPEPSVDELRFREQRYRRGAHHAVDVLATGIERAATLEEAQRLANIFTNVVGEARHRDGGEFDLSLMMREAEKRLHNSDPEGD